MPFSAEQLQHSSARTLLSLLKPSDELQKLLDAPFVLYDFPFVKLATPVSFHSPLQQCGYRQKFSFPACGFYSWFLGPLQSRI